MSPKHHFDFSAYWQRSRAIHERMAAVGVRMFLVRVADVCWEWWLHADKTRDAFRDDVRRFLDSEASACLTSNPNAPELLRQGLTQHLEAAGYVRLTDLASDSWTGQLVVAQAHLEHDLDEEQGRFDAFGLEGSEAGESSP